MTDTSQPILAGVLDYDPALPYAFDVDARVLYAFALQSRYLESGSWPDGGLPVPEDVAQTYMNDPDRDLKIVVKSGEAFTITVA